MKIFEVVMVNNFGAVSQFITAEEKPTIKEMNYYFDRFMVNNHLNRVSEVIEVTKTQFDKWNKNGDYKLHNYTSKKSNKSVNKNVIQAKCIQKFRDNKGKIYGYRLVDLNGQTQDVTPDNLKNAIRLGHIHIVNLTLTSDNRLMDTSEKQLQAKVLGKSPVDPVEKLDETYKDVAKALVYLDKETIDTGDDYEDCVYGRYHQAFDKEPNITSSTNIDELMYKAFLKMTSDKSGEISDLIGYWEEYEYYDTFEHHIQYENVDSINKSKIYKALVLVYKYAKEHKFSKKVVTPLKDFLDRIKTTGIAAINVGYNAGHTYYRYLDGNIFGTISNDVFTVGHAITSSDIKEHKEYKGYSYVFHKDINKCGKPAISIAALFKNAEAGKVQADLKIERHGYLNERQSCVGIRGYILDIETIILDNDESNEANSKIIAKKFNEIAPKLYDLADIHQSLYSNLGYNKPLEKVQIEDLNSHGRLSGKELVDLAISRWTTIRGDRTPARIDKMDYQSDTSFRLIYANNISDNGNNRKLYIKYNGEEITLKVLDGNDINKVIIEENAQATGSIVDNSSILSEVICKALISANVRRI